MLKERCCSCTLSNHVIFSFSINFVLISVSVQHEKSVQQKKDGFPPCHELKTEKKKTPHEEFERRPAHSVLHRGAGGVIRRK